MIPKDVKQRNTEANQASVVFNVSVKTSELLNIQQEIEKSNFQLGEIKNNIAEILKYKEEVLLEIESEKKSLDEFKKQIEKQKEYLDNEKKMFDIFVRKESQKIESIQNKLSLEINEHVSVLDKIEKDKNNKQKELDRINESIDENSKKVESLKKAFTEMENLYSSSVDIYSINMPKMTKALKEKEEEYKNLIAEIEDIRQKTADPYKKLEAREKLVEIKERNLNLYISRFRKEFKKLHPNLEPKI